MKTTQEERDRIRGALNVAGTAQCPNSLYSGQVRDLLDDADELARLREGLQKEIAMYRGPGSPMLLVMSLETVHRVADRLEDLLNGDGDGD